MTLSEFIGYAQQRSPCMDKEIASFGRQWKKANQICPKFYPLEMEATDWWDQFVNGHWKRKEGKGDDAF